MPSEHVAGVLSFQLNGSAFRMKGTWTYNLGRVKREAVVGSDGVHGFKEMPQVPFMEGAVTDGRSLVMDDLLDFTDGTCTLHLRNGKVIELRDAWFAGEGTVDTEESEIAVRFEGLGGEEVRP